MAATLSTAEPARAASVEVDAGQRGGHLAGGSDRSNESSSLIGDTRLIDLNRPDGKRLNAVGVTDIHRKGAGGTDRGHDVGQHFRYHEAIKVMR